MKKLKLAFIAFSLLLSNLSFANTEISQKVLDQIRQMQESNAAQVYVAKINSLQNPLEMAAANMLAGKLFFKVNSEFRSFSNALEDLVENNDDIESKAIFSFAIANFLQSEIGQELLKDSHLLSKFEYKFDKAVRNATKFTNNTFAIAAGTFIGFFVGTVIIGERGTHVDDLPIVFLTMLAGGAGGFILNNQTGDRSLSLETNKVDSNKEVEDILEL
jgi:hypothetical protein